MASWASLDGETGRKWGLKDKKTKAALKMYCILQAMSVLPQEQPSTSHLFPYLAPAQEEFLLPAAGHQLCAWMSRSLHTLKTGRR